MSAFNVSEPFWENTEVTFIFNLFVLLVQSKNKLAKQNYREQTSHCCLQQCGMTQLWWKHRLQRLNSDIQQIGLCLGFFRYKKKEVNVRSRFHARKTSEDMEKCCIKFERSMKILKYLIVIVVWPCKILFYKSNKNTLGFFAYVKALLGNECISVRVYDSLQRSQSRMAIGE